MNRSKYYGTSEPVLYIVATPIGNKKEFSLRAQETLKEVACIGCEDTRTSSLLFQDFQIHTPLIACHEHNENEASEKLLRLMREGNSIAYVSDAGYPGISDPGHRLILKAIDEGFHVVTIGGSTAFLPALIGSGLETEHFYFHGFLKSKPSQRKKELEKLKDKEETLIFYESPHRILDTLEDMYRILGNRKACIAREITKIHEEFIRGTLEEFITIPLETLKGEMVVVIEGATEVEDTIDEGKIIYQIKAFMEQGETPKSAIQLTAQLYKLPKNDVYSIYLKTKR